MSIDEIEFVGSFEHESQCPDNSLPEYAFIGRSNVGKSSLINALAGRKAIAHISSTPGKTQTLNYFLVNQSWHLVDLPGYGYAKISKTKRKRWKQMIEKYLLVRSNLYCVFHLIDSRHDLQENDRDFMDWLGEHQIPFVVVFTKYDKLKQSDKKRNIDALLNSISKYWDPLPMHFVTSANTREGIDAILEFISETNKTTA